MKTHHVSTNIERLLQFSDDQLESMFDSPGAEVRSELEERKANGEIKIGSEGCEGFDPVNGCPGHEVEVFHNIIKVDFSGKWMLLWLDELPFEKKQNWSETNQQFLDVVPQEWKHNLSCKAYKVLNLLGDHYENEEAKDKDLAMNGYNLLLNFSLQLDKDYEPIKLKRWKN